MKDDFLDQRPYPYMNVNINGSSFMMVDLVTGAVYENELWGWNEE